MQEARASGLTAVGLERGDDMWWWWCSITSGLKHCSSPAFREEDMGGVRVMGKKEGDNIPVPSKVRAYERGDIVFCHFDVGTFVL
jgi:hypothetical protein